MNSHADFLIDGVISAKLRHLVPFSGKFSLHLCKIGCNSTIGVNCDVVNELYDPDFLEGEVISTIWCRLA
jgi:hypothetical protein